MACTSAINELPTSKEPTHITSNRQSAHAEAAVCVSRGVAHLFNAARDINNRRYRSHLSVIYESATSMKHVLSSAFSSSRSWTTPVSDAIVTVLCVTPPLVVAAL